MGLIKAAVDSAKSVFKDQWKDYFYCDAMPNDVLVRKAIKKNGTDNILTNGSVIAVADGQCMLIVDNGNVVDYCAEPGEYTFDQATEPSFFDGGKLIDNAKKVLANMGKRFTFGGVAAKDQRVYYFNTRELPVGKFGTANPVPFRVVDNRANIDIDINVKCFGDYTIKLTNPILFYTNVCGNISGDYRIDNLESQMKSEFLTALQPAFAKISAQQVRYSEIPAYTQQLADAMNEQLSAKWRDLRGIEIVSLGVSSIVANEDDEKLLKSLQKAAALRDPNAAAAYSVSQQGEAVVAAANNANGAAAGVMGVGMVNNLGGNTAANLFAVGQQNQQAQATPAANEWTCSCGAKNTGNFCTNCGAKRPDAAWTCSCGTQNTGNFCTNCGAKRP